MKKILLSFLLLAITLPAFGQQNVDEFKFSLVPRRVAAPSLTGYVKADGSVPLTADWNVGPFDITAVDLTATGSVKTPKVVAGSVTPTTWSSSAGSFDGGTNAVVFGNAGDFHLVSNAKGLAQWTYYGAGPAANIYIYAGGFNFRTAPSGVADAAITWNDRFSVDINGNAVFSNSAKVTAQQITPGSGTGLTVDDAGSLNRQVYKVTVDYTGFSAAALTADHTIATLPAKTKIVGFYADTTVPFTGGGVTAAALKIGKTAGGGEYIASHDVMSSAIIKGLADADMGTELVRAAQIQGGTIMNWTGTTTVVARLTTVTANTNALTAGSVTFYIVTERF